jgi:hypothetical protein
MSPTCRGSRGRLAGLGGPNLLPSYEIERRQVGERNVAASRHATLGRRNGALRTGPTSATTEGKQPAPISRALPMWSSAKPAR